SARHGGQTPTELEKLRARHKGNAEVYLQITTSATQKVTMRLDRERFVKPSRELVDDLELVLGSGCIQLCGAGTRRKKKITAQQQLFKEEEQAEVGGAPIPPAVSVDPLLDPAEMD